MKTPLVTSPNVSSFLAAAIAALCATPAARATDLNVPSNSPMTLAADNYTYGTVWLGNNGASTLNIEDGVTLSCTTFYLMNGNGQFSYTRRDPSLTHLTYTVEYSTDLSAWHPATLSEPESVGPPDSNGVETVTVKVSNAALDGKLFVRVKAL
ncbi:MAG: hypothetical protein NTW21_00110 [Verrucomicrobia bacterium]|nr:hypothetical protein [Verrucomicrobiota bacterium]